MRRGEIWFAAMPDGDRPPLILTRDPVTERIDSLLVAPPTRTERGLVSEVRLDPQRDGVPTACVVNLYTLDRRSFRRRIAVLSPARVAEACRARQAATGC